MNIAISNIAWTANEEPAVAKELQKLGVRYVEIAPTRTWADPTKVSDAQIAQYTNFWAAHGISIVAFQSMLFGRLDLTIFDNPATRAKTSDYLKSFIHLAGRIGAGVLVFGSPKNRQVHDMPLKDAWPIAKDFFSTLGDAATADHTAFCIEPNPTQYDCDFVTTADQGRKLVAETNSPGFGLHLDAAGMTLAGDDPQKAIQGAKDYLRHFHISAPYLGNIEEQTVKHHLMAATLKKIGYQGYCSIEMRPAEEGANVARVAAAVKIAQKYYN